MSRLLSSYFGSTGGYTGNIVKNPHFLRHKEVHYSSLFAGTGSSGYYPSVEYQFWAQIDGASFLGLYDTVNNTAKNEILNVSGPGLFYGFLSAVTGGLVSEASKIHILEIIVDDETYTIYLNNRYNYRTMIGLNTQPRSLEYIHYNNAGFYLLDPRYATNNPSLFFENSLVVNYQLNDRFTYFEPFSTYYLLEYKLFNEYPNHL